MTLAAAGTAIGIAFVIGTIVGTILMAVLAAGGRADLAEEWRERCERLRNALTEETRLRSAAEAQVVTLKARLDRQREEVSI